MNFKVGNFTWGAGLTFFIVLFSSCASLRKSNTLFQSEYDKFADTAKTVYVANEQTSQDSFYKIKPFDLIGVRNLQNPQGLIPVLTIDGAQATTIFKVDENGDVTLPVVGKLRVANLTIVEASKKIQKSYGDKLLQDPIIEVTVINFKVTLLGDVIKPGNYQLENEQYHLIDLIGKSGGLLATAEPGRIRIIRGDKSQPEIIFVNLKDVNALSSSKLYLKPNDIIYVPQRSIYLVNQNISYFSGLAQPLILLLNAAVLLYTLSR